MRASAGLRPLDTEPAPMFPSPRLGSSPARLAPKTPTPKKKSAVKRKSSLGETLKRVSAARGVPVAEILAEQGAAASPAEGRRGPVIRRSPGAEKVQLNNSRAPAGKVVRPMRKVLASGGRGMPTPGSGSSSYSGSGNSGSSSAKLMKSRSRLDLGAKRDGQPSNLVGKTGQTSFLPAKPKGPTLAEIQEQKEEEMKKKAEKEVETKARREELLKKKADEQREKREERIRRVQEARQKQEDQKETKLRVNQEKEKEEKLALLKKREEMQKAESRRKQQETELKMKEAEERRQRDQGERQAKQEKIEQEKIENEKRREAEKKKELEEYRKVLKAREGDEKKKAEDDKRKKKDEEEKRGREEEKQRVEEAKKREQVHTERIIREREELKRIKEREAARQAEVKKAVLDTTYEKPVNKALNSTQTLDQSSQGKSSYDMTPARHELPPEPLKDENDYGLEDLNSGGDTDDEDCPRKEVPKWAEGTNLRTALLKQCYMPPDLDHIFMVVDMPDLSTMFVEQRKRFFKRTSSACWEQPPESFKHSSKRF